MKKNFQKAHEVVERSSFIFKNLLATKGAKVGGPSLQVDIMSEKKETTKGHFYQLPERISIRLESKKLDDYMENIANYAFLTTMLVMISFFVMLNQIKLIAENQAMAESFSLLSISLNLIWNFFFFIFHFMLSIQGEYLQYLGLPAFWYFISSFTFESRMFIQVWRSQL